VCDQGDAAPPRALLEKSTEPGEYGQSLQVRPCRRVPAGHCSTSLGGPGCAGARTAAECVGPTRAADSARRCGTSVRTSTARAPLTRTTLRCAGILVEGIFRRSPSAAKLAQVKDQLHRGPPRRQWRRSTDDHSISHLLRVGGEQAR
jgi:hypothetical protein